MPSLLPPALSQLSGQFCQGRILQSDHPVTRDHWPSSLCVRFQAISRGGIVNGQVSQLWRISSSQYLLFGAVKWSNIHHKLFIKIDSECSQITDHPGVKGRCLNITDTVSRLDTRCQCLESDGHYASLAIVTRNHCSRSRCCSWCWVTLLPHFLGLRLCRALPPSAHGAGRRSLGSVTRLKTQQFRGELYRYNIHTETLIHLVEIISVWWIT